MPGLETLDLGPCPSDEECAQVGSDGYSGRAHRECAAWRDQVRRHFSTHGRVMPDSCQLAIDSHTHDFGQYHEVAVMFDPDDQPSVEFTNWLEESLPSRWDEIARQELGPQTGVLSSLVLRVVAFAEDQGDLRAGEFDVLQALVRELEDCGR